MQWLNIHTFTITLDIGNNMLKAFFSAKYYLPNLPFNHPIQLERHQDHNKYEFDGPKTNDQLMIIWVYLVSFLEHPSTSLTISFILYPPSQVY